MATVLHITSAWDTTTDLVIKALNTMGVSSTRLNTEAFPTRALLAVTANDHHFDADLVTDSKRHISLADVRSIYYRRPEPASFAAHDKMTHESRAFCTKESFAALIGFLRASGSRWINDPDVTGPAEFKVEQLRVARMLGFSVPRTLITNDPKKAREFIGRLPGAALVKTVRSPRISRSDSRLAYAHVLTADDLGQLDAIALAPCIFQEYVAKEIEVRVVVVGREIFSTAIHSQALPQAAIDWRKADYNLVNHEPYELRPEVAGLCLRFVEHYKLTFATFDLIVRPDGSYVFLECNPNGEWGWIEGVVGHPISMAIARLLAHA